MKAFIKAKVQKDPAHLQRCKRWFHHSSW